MCYVLCANRHLLFEEMAAILGTESAANGSNSTGNSSAQGDGAWGSEVNFGVAGAGSLVGAAVLAWKVYQRKRQTTTEGNITG